MVHKLEKLVGDYKPKTYPLSCMGDRKSKRYVQVIYMVHKLKTLVGNYKPKTYPLSCIGDRRLRVTIPCFGRGGGRVNRLSEGVVVFDGTAPEKAGPKDVTKFCGPRKMLQT